MVRLENQLKLNELLLMIIMSMIKVHYELVPSCTLIGENKMKVEMYSIALKHG